MTMRQMICWRIFVLMLLLVLVDCCRYQSQAFGLRIRQPPPFGNFCSLFFGLTNLWRHACPSPKNNSPYSNTQFPTGLGGLQLHATVDCCWVGRVCVEVSASTSTVLLSTVLRVRTIEDWSSDGRDSLSRLLCVGVACLLVNGPWLLLV